MNVSTELQFEHCPHCGGDVKTAGSHRKRCEGCGTVYFFYNDIVRDGELNIRELDRSEHRKEVERRLVAARLKGGLERSRREKPSKSSLKSGLKESV